MPITTKAHQSNIHVCNATTFGMSFWQSAVQLFNFNNLQAKVHTFEMIKDYIDWDD